MKVAREAIIAFSRWNYTVCKLTRSSGGLSTLGANVMCHAHLVASFHFHTNNMGLCHC